MGAWEAWMSPHPADDKTTMNHGSSKTDHRNQPKVFETKDLPTILTDLIDNCVRKTACKAEDIQELIRASNMAPKPERQRRSPFPNHK